MSESRADIMLEVSRWAGSRRDGRVRGPDLVMNDRNLEIWRDGYNWAMNEAAQHFNMEYLSTKKWSL